MGLNKRVATSYKNLYEKNINSEKAEGGGDGLNRDDYRQDCNLCEDSWLPDKLARNVGATVCPQ